MGVVQREGLGWHGVAKLIVERNRRDHQISAVFHPEAEGEVLETKLGNVRVAKGDASYQLTTGEVVSL